MTPDAARENLQRIKRIVVLMMENRSFDHMLGYLTRAGMPEVNGLSGTEQNLDADGTAHRVFEFPADQTAFHKPGDAFDNSLDPCHSPDCVRDQLADNNGGFVKNFVAMKAPPPEWRRLPMGHYTAEHLPVYDFLARQYCVCDAWHSSIPGDTWPNRLYSIAGQAGPRVHLRLIERLAALVTGKAPNLPIYAVEAFTRQLADRQWRWYSHDPATLRGADKHYRSFDLHRGNFAYFDRKKVSLVTQTLEEAIVGHDSFLDDAAKDQLRDVSWIDPNFIDVHVLESVSNDDHPPADIRAGQGLAFDLYDALVRTRDWPDTMLVICYDEHGGFYDHVTPPPVSDGSGYPTYGVRVPVIVIGPRVKRFVCHQQLDHTSLIKTILLRFAANPQEALAKMPLRVQRAPHLGIVLEDQPRTDIPAHDELHPKIEAWRLEARATRRAGAGAPSSAPDGAGQPLVPNEFQDEFVKFARALQRRGLPSGHP